MLGIKTLEAEINGILVKGSLQLNAKGAYQLDLLSPYPGPMFTFFFPKTYHSLWDGHVSEIEKDAISYLRTLFHKCENIKREVPKFQRELKEFWLEIDTISVLSPLEWNEKCMFLKKALQEGYMDSDTYEKTLSDLTLVMEKKYLEREKRCELFLSQYLPEYSHLQNHFSWIRFCYELTEKKHLLLL
ncbi:hypothetical protein EHQ68_08805 [Leptospira congkakensis]|uniref:Uncharacterized protein n=1 Tax=Leptospira congkakensis TaxID=2484932 RepID=A0A4Z1AAW6_9LEPT|nr:hypothetical protein [Leptospira congkakensis]TGL88727.1 hypothetical protein EHQ69_14875 [Leptospira congkakensis]TGL89313.1 hypothetical protein EHQ68_08805 [Leptospira congkakensis]TGL97281.1 hypothetical protein EHQ70_08300 [Leptospira congkakensis]